MVKLVIFDLDGTLLDTTAQVQALLNQTLAEYKLPLVSLDMTRRSIGDGAKILIDRVVENESLRPVVLESFNKIYAVSDNSLSTTFEGEDEVLEFLRKKHVKMAILSNKPHAATLVAVENCLTAHYFDMVLGQTDAYPIKPNPLSTLAIIEHFAIDKKKCILIGDGETDIQTAIAAKIKHVGALWGNRSKEQLEAVGCKHFAQNFKELLEILKKTY